MPTEKKFKCRDCGQHKLLNGYRKSKLGKRNRSCKSCLGKKMWANREKGKFGVKAEYNVIDANHEIWGFLYSPWTP